METLHHEQKLQGEAHTCGSVYLGNGTGIRLELTKVHGAVSAAVQNAQKSRVWLRMWCERHKNPGYSETTGK